MRVALRPRPGKSIRGSHRTQTAASAPFDGLTPQYRVRWGTHAMCVACLTHDPHALPRCSMSSMRTARAARRATPPVQRNHAMTSPAAAPTQTSASLLEDGTNPVLNTVAHAQEHCALDVRTLDGLASAVGRQVLVRRSRNRLALYTIAELNEAAAAELHVGTAGAARLKASAALRSWRAPTSHWRRASSQATMRSQLG